MAVGDEDNNLVGGLTRVDKYYLLVIGIDNYQGGVPSLNNAVSDAKRVAKALHTYRFDAPLFPADLNKSASICLYDKDATWDNIDKSIKAIHGKIKENDALLIYFAGHGVRAVNENYYIVPSDGVKDKFNTYMQINELYNLFKEYPQKKKCRDLLIVLDSCYAGKALAGYGQRVNQGFSRYILTSSLESQPANDGLIGRGSVFANELINTLEGNNDIMFSFDRAYDTFRKKFEKSGQQLLGQHLDRGPVPTIENGSGSFTFEKSETVKPELTFLKNSLIDHLNFTNQRYSLLRSYKSSRNSLNIITTQGYSFNVQRVLSKIIFRWLAKNGNLNLKPEKCFIEDFIKVDEDTRIWDTIYGQIKDDAGKMPNDKEVIVNWYFQKLEDEQDSMSSTRHAIIPIGFDIGGADMFKAIEAFCSEFSELFIQRFAKLDEAKKRTYGKMFIVISDERENAGGSHAELLKNITSQSFNFIPTDSVPNINWNDAKDWTSRFSDENLGEKIQALKEEDGLTELCGDEDFDACYEEFIRRLCAYCKYTNDDITTLNSYLYDFTNKNLL